MGNYSSSAETQPLINESKNDDISIVESSEEIKNIPKMVNTSSYIHPLIKLINSSTSENEIINTVISYCGIQKISENEYDIVDQFELFAPMTQLFCHCACYGKKQVVEWIMNNYIPLNVSYSDNFSYYECLKYGHTSIAELIVKHESFNPDATVLINLLDRNKSELFIHCMNNSNLDIALSTVKTSLIENIQLYRFDKIRTFLKKYIEDKSINNELLNTIVIENIVSVDDDPIIVNFGDVSNNDNSVQTIPEQPTQEVVEQSAQEVVEQPTQEVVEQSAQEVVEQPTQEVVEQPAQEVVEQSVQEVVEQPVQEVVEQSVQEVVEQPVQEVVEQPVQEVVEQPAQEVVEQPAQEVVGESVKNTLKKIIEKVVEEPAQEVVGESKIVGESVKNTLEKLLE
ncbi:ankyrin repeat protein [Megavirus baoshan]|uniref:Ankyrin repeat protein n=1 Tax=Megavirus baoshan TaxID=2496520 RepID=A0A3Q8U7L2_9VIRU|nr:ankyrin repeat protein [Megavirus baoshan]AZL89186.1 ankyrin repeat protein [Megavirus baoshan]